jgi:hypothetical protein
LHQGCTPAALARMARAAALLGSFEEAVVLLQAEGIDVSPVFYSSQAVLFVSRCLMDAAWRRTRAHGATCYLFVLTIDGNK